ncbi:hypothetical protein [Parasphingorhabdus halotolerans]|uniref:Uncharacterized protein n=1 Tax=Parasphingorhabdus halotolerans TaxID=2725558 RepID=A0A6H2DSA1_9SPHN|nr:hypothetical protein [Parasphingorhabdus halotolerans]QJB70835.1 hypothetical protein HF685_12625 [Parasphingorhabdus halotolerans]
MFSSGFVLPDTARADVTVTFYSHEFGESFPHAFYTVKGKLDNGQIVDDAHGFTAINVSPAILWGSVKGIVKAPPANYIAKSDSQFSISISDAAYRKLMAKVAKWKAIPQKSYNLNKRNCVHFVEDAMALLGLKTNPKTKYRKKPTSFMKEIVALNPGLKK